MNLFNWLDFETISSCNRACPTCLRNSHPDRIAVQSWFEKHYLEMDVIEAALDQANHLGFGGGVRLSHFNEPMMDERLPELGWLVRSYGYKPYLNSNGDFLTEDLAYQLDGVFEQIIVALYMKDPVRSQRAEWIPSLFKRTEIQISFGEHVPSHFSPKFDVKYLAQQNQNNTCREPEMRLIINHRRQYLLCCEDLIGTFDLGTFPEISLKDYWFGKRAEIQERLLVHGGRKWHPHCASCPKS